jgi:hypothetical protein
MPDASSDADLQRCIVDCLECYSLCRQEAIGGKAPASSSRSSSPPLTASTSQYESSG